MTKCLFGLTGPHGSGKTTILQAVKEKGIRVDESQISRTAQAKLGWSSLKEAEESPEKMWALQTEILKAMKGRDTWISATGIPTLVDRTPADVWGYTSLWAERIGRDKIDPEQLRNFQAQCEEAAVLYERQIFFPIRNEIPFVSQSNRADEKSRVYHSTVVLTFLDSRPFPRRIMETLSIEDRVCEVLNVMNIFSDEGIILYRQQHSNYGAA